MPLENEDIVVLREALRQINEATTKVRNSADLQGRLSSLNSRCQLFKDRAVADTAKDILAGDWKMVEEQLDDIRLVLEAAEAGPGQEPIAKKEVAALLEAAARIAQDLGGDNRGNVKSGCQTLVEKIGAAARVCHNLNNRELNNIWLISARLLGK